MYLDTNIFLHAKFDGEKKGDAARAILARIQQGTPAVTSALVVSEASEVLRRRWRPHLRATIEALYQTPNLRIVPVDEAAARRALHYIEINNLKASDALHLAIMEELGETTIVSDDTDFDGIAGITRIGLR
jgi:predicted nucleic acid-binding protein